MAPGGTGLRRVLTTATLSASLSCALTGVVGCSQGVDLAHSVQTRLGGVDGVVAADVTAPSDAHAAYIALTIDPGLEPSALLALVRDVARVAHQEDYPSYRLELDPVDEEGDVLVVDDGFAGRDDELAVLDNWQAVTRALLGAVTYTVEGGLETVAARSEGALLHDATEASRIGYGGATTTWRFTSGSSELLVTGRMSTRDVDMLQRIQRSAASSELRIKATSWRLERRPTHVLLALQVGLPDSPPGSPPDPPRITLERYAADLGPLVRAALGAVIPGGRPVWLQLRHDTTTGDDVFAYWVSDQRPVRGRDRLDRGWDRWLFRLAAA